MGDAGVSQAPLGKTLGGGDCIINKSKHDSKEHLFCLILLHTTMITRRLGRAWYGYDGWKLLDGSITELLEPVSCPIITSSCRNRSDSLRENGLLLYQAGVSTS